MNLEFANPVHIQTSFKNITNADSSLSAFKWKLNLEPYNILV